MCQDLCQISASARSARSCDEETNENTRDENTKDTVNPTPHYKDLGGPSGLSFYILETYNRDKEMKKQDCWADIDYEHGGE